MSSRHIISVLVENHFGVLARVSSLIAGRGFNIDSLSVGETEEPDISRMTVVTHGDEQIIEQIIKQLNRLVDVIKVTDLTESSHVERELALMKVHTPTPGVRSEIFQIAEVFRAKIVDISANTVTVEVTGPQEKVEAFTEMMVPFGIRELARTGAVGLSRERSTRESADLKVA